MNYGYTYAIIAGLLASLSSLFMKLFMNIYICKDLFFIFENYLFFKKEKVII